MSDNTKKRKGSQRLFVHVLQCGSLVCAFCSEFNIKKKSLCHIFTSGLIRFRIKITQLLMCVFTTRSVCPCDSDPTGKLLTLPLLFSKRWFAAMMAKSQTSRKFIIVIMESTLSLQPLCRNVCFSYYSKKKSKAKRWEELGREIGGGIVSSVKVMKAGKAFTWLK